MQFYDLHVHTAMSIGNDSVTDIAEFAKRLDLSAIGVVQYYGTHTEDISKIEGIDLVRVLMIKPRSAVELGNMTTKARSKCEILVVHGGDYEVNRAACENSMVDLLAHPELGRRDSGLDHISMKSAAENNVAIEINFREILETARRSRTYVLSAMRKNARLAKKYSAPVVVSSGAISKWGLRGGRELAAVAHLLGFELGDAIRCVSEIPRIMVEKNREKLANKRWQGVVVED